MKISDRKTWPWLLVFIIGGAVLILFVPPIQHAILKADIALAYALNSFLGHNSALDRLVGTIVTRNGDKVLFSALCLICTLHIFARPRNSHDVADRAAFWIWAVALFFAFYFFQRVFDGMLQRESPGKSLPNWIRPHVFLRRGTRTTSRNCFPSGHASLLFGLAFLALRRYRGVGLVLLAIATVVMSLRVMTGAHWPSDIILGSLPLMGLFAALMFETRLATLHTWLRGICSDVLGQVVHWRGRKLSDRFRSGWKAFLAPTQSSDYREDVQGPSLPASDEGDES